MLVNLTFHKIGAWIKLDPAQLLHGCSAALRGRRSAYAATLSHPVYESSFWTSKVVLYYDMSHNHLPVVVFSTPGRN